MLTRAADYEDIVKNFQWAVPRYYNIGVDVCDRQNPNSVALIYCDADQKVTNYSFGDLSAYSNRFANVLISNGLQRGDRVAILLPQAPETAIAHIAVYKSGMIAVPLFTLFGEDALEYRLAACGARALVTNRENLPRIAAIKERLPDLEVIYSIDGAGDPGATGFHDALEKASDRFRAVKTLAEDPALIIFTSGTTGPPKGALHAHRVLLGHLPGVEFPHNFFPQPEDCFWTPADWAWIGGLMDVLLPSLHHGIPVLAYRARKFDPEEAFSLMARFRIRNAFIPPTALKLMRQVPNPAARYEYAMRSIGSGGEMLGAELLEWGREAFGLTMNEFYGQTECNLVIGNSAACMPIRPGSMGRAIPGHRVGIVDDAGHLLEDGETGHIAIHRPDPVMFLGYWKDEEATQQKFSGDWLLTGDTGSRRKDGYFQYVGRQDDVITTAGYRVGPGEIEECLMRHPAISMAAVIGVPDSLRTQSIKAFLVPVEGVVKTEELISDIQTFVKTKLAAHEYPRQITFVKSLPMTATGKIMRHSLRNMTLSNPALYDIE